MNGWSLHPVVSLVGPSFETVFFSLPATTSLIPPSILRMSSLNLFSVILCLFSLLSLTSASGHLRLEFTSSQNSQIRLITDYSDETILLVMGEKRTSSFHLNERKETLRIGLASPDGITEFYQFALRNTGQQLRQIFEFSEVVVLIQSVYECDFGFYGSKCELKGVPTTKTTVTTTTEMKKTTTQSSANPLTSLFSSADYNRIIILILVFVILTLTALIIVFGILLVSSSRTQHTIIADTTQEFGKEKKMKEFDESMEGEPRYVSDPFRTVFIEKSELSEF